MTYQRAVKIVFQVKRWFFLTVNRGVNVGATGE
jgi:hypothetical protein